MVPYRSQVTPVVHGDNAHTNRLGLVDGNAHGLGTEDDTEPTITVDWQVLGDSRTIRQFGRGL